MGGMRSYVEKFGVYGNSGCSCVSKCRHPEHLNIDCFPDGSSMSSRARIRLPLGIELSCPECPRDLVPKILRTVERKIKKKFRTDRQKCFTPKSNNALQPKIFCMRKNAFSGKE